MNNGKICVSVCAGNAEKLIEQIKPAEELADVIEIRFDCLQPQQINKIFSLLVSTKPLLLTYRPQEQGGKIEMNLDQRRAFWNAFIINGLTNTNRFWFDLEFDLLNLQKVSNPITIRSFHDFEGVPENLLSIFESVSQNAEVAKVAIQPNDITDSIAIWKLLKRAKSENKQFIPIAMGEAGKWTRILGLAHGAFMTYASLDSGNETAPGQVSAKDLIEVYRAKELDENTEVYGIIGNPVSHSVSPEMHNAAFKFHKLNAVYIPFEVKNLDEFITRMVKPETREIDLNFRGFSVTIPHKQAIIKHLDFIDPTAKAIGAVNTVKIVDGKLHGYNTDAQGFIEPLENVYGDLNNVKVAIFGAGGASRACVYALKKDGANVTIFARDIEKAKSLVDEFEVEIQDLSKIKNQSSKYYLNNFDIVVNSTPLGMKGDLVGETPVVAEQIRDVKLVYDLVFNPFQTQFMNEADKVNIPKIGGMAMLVAQGAAQQKIWTGKEAPLKEMSQAVLRKLQK
jgi:3-dehydroquinate dehydratase / shikimate dehydrogenase